MSKYGYLDVFFEGPFDFEITRVDCIFNVRLSSSTMRLTLKGNDSVSLSKGRPLFRKGTNKICRAHSLKRILIRFSGISVSLSSHYQTTILGSVNPLYKDVRYDSKIRYNVSSVSIKAANRVFVSLTVPYYCLGKHIYGYVRIASPRRF